MPDWQALSLEGVPLFFLCYNYVRDVIYKKALLLEITHSPLLPLSTDHPSTRLPMPRDMSASTASQIIQVRNENDTREE